MSPLARQGGMLALPKGFTPMRDIIDERVPQGRIVNVVGIVKDCRLPIPTSGTDSKCTLRLYDLSTEDGSEDLLLTIFRPLSEMPQVGAGDVVLLFSIKVQRYRSDPVSLLTCYTTDIHVYMADKIPIPPKPAYNALRPSVRLVKRMPGVHEDEYVSWLYHKIDKGNVPDSAQFQLHASQSLNIKQKFSELKDVKEGRFYDVIGQVAREPYDLGDKMTVWITDYTENSAFYNFAWGGGNDAIMGQDGDPYGYASAKLAIKSNSNRDWAGPFGKKTMQVTCYEPHATAIRSQVIHGSWVKLRNLQVKYGNNSTNLEGYLREDRQAAGTKIQVNILDPTDDPENIDPRLKEALRRKRDYEKEKRGQLKDLKAGKHGKKRPATDQAESNHINSKAKRAMKRAEIEKKIVKKEVDVESLLNLNEQVKCENHDQQASPVSSIIALVPYPTSVQGSPVTLQLPFTCAKYRANVRVVDFHPQKLEDFACSRKTTEYDILSDNEGDSSESDSDEDIGTLDAYVRERTWEWRFALQLEDAALANKAPKQRVWVIVDNESAQLLTGLDACDFRANPEILATLRERLFILWGELEEEKAKQLLNKKTAIKSNKINDRPLIDSSDDEESGRAQKESQPGKGSSEIANRPFSCCIQQYGVKVTEQDTTSANAGKGKRWERVFALFGTKVSSG